MSDHELNADDFGDEAYKDPEILRELYWDVGLSTPKMSDILGVSKKTVLNWMKKHDIDRRPTRRRPWATYCMVNGYMRWTVSTSDGNESMLVSRLLAISEYGVDAVKGNDVHHKNGITWLNTPKNIELKERSDHSSFHNTGSKSVSAKLTESDVREIKSKISEVDSLASLGREYGVSRQTVYDIRDGKTWTHVDP